ncbi:hypothetical protein NC315_29695 [Streptomyces sp. G2]|uniref:hypothetical protein n=1 Tax=Streptomyces sp. G2 TaxID=1684471 RepID=UPI00202E0EF9|nr:hypothetical protein [Streptomyces sp. G2]MCM1949515.1 hypothetical protein [Streptomyces sp. G2]
MNARTLSDLTAPLTALIVLDTKFSHLPAPNVDFCPVYPDRLRLSLHDDLGAFEAWREALNIDPAAVVHRVQGGGGTRVLKVHGRFAGADIELVGFAPVPEREAAELGLGAVS